MKISTSEKRKVESEVLILCTFFRLVLHFIIILNQLRYYQIQIYINSSVGISNVDIEGFFRCFYEVIHFSTQFSLTVSDFLKDSSSRSFFYYYFALIVSFVTMRTFMKCSHLRKTQVACIMLPRYEQ